MMKRIVSVIGLFAVLIASFVSISITDSKSIVSYKTYKEGNSNSQMARKILSDNTLQEEKVNMFNYASNGNYINSSFQQSNDPEYITKGLYSALDEDGISYYYRGDVDNNYVQFGEYTEDYYVYAYGSGYFQSLEACKEYSSQCNESNRFKFASKGDKMYWRIVRVNGDGSLRLIYNGTSANPTNSDLANSFAVGQSPYNLDYNDPKYTGYTYDNGTDSFIKKEVDTWYKNVLGNTEYDSKVVGERFCSDTSGYKPASEYGFADSDFNVFASYDRLGQSATGYQKENSPSLKCPSTTESYGGSYRLKVGLIIADELVLAGESLMVVSDSYLNIGSSNIPYWSMTPCVVMEEVSFVFYEKNSIIFQYYGNTYFIRPVINVKVDNGFTSGDGTASNPYVIS